MTDRHDQPPSYAFRLAEVSWSAPHGIAVNANDRYDHRLNGFPSGCLPPSRWYLLPLLDPDVGRGRDWRRLRFEVVR